jgi:hypothetical protein
VASSPVHNAIGSYKPQKVIAISIVELACILEYIFKAKSTHSTINAAWLGLSLFETALRMRNNHTGWSIVDQC